MSAAASVDSMMPNGEGPSKGFEQYFTKIMEPDKYKKKYGWKEKRKVAPPSYLCKPGARVSNKKSKMPNDLSQFGVPKMVQKGSIKPLS